MLASWLALAPEARLALASYLLAMGVLGLFGLHRYSLVWRARRVASTPPAAPGTALSVTVQLPIYNELHVANRLLRAATALAWPRHLLEIQVLDDSDDDTAEAVAATVAELSAQGHRVAHIRRSARDGFKAGALANGLETATGELIAVFDADFVPAPDFLRSLVPYFDASDVGMVQARWGHLNREVSLLTKLQAIMLDAHFLIDQAARWSSGCFFNFNGTAGVWRRQAIVDAGGWTSNTVTEDLDLSYRAQLRGWRFAFVPEVVVPAELPAELNAFKSQQHRWAQGSVQTMRRILPTLLRAPQPARVKLEAVFHLTSNFVYPLLLALALLSGPVLAARSSFTWSQALFLDFPLFLLGTLSVATFYAAACAKRPTSTPRSDGLGSHPIWLLPALMALGVGVAINNTRAVVAGLIADAGEFRRTPKAGGTTSGRYRLGPQAWVIAEVGLGVHMTYVAATAAAAGQWLSLPFLFLFMAGFLGTGLLSLAALLPSYAGTARGIDGIAMTAPDGPVLRP